MADTGRFRPIGAIVNMRCHLLCVTMFQSDYVFHLDFDHLLISVNNVLSDQQRSLSSLPERFYSYTKREHHGFKGLERIDLAVETTQLSPAKRVFQFGRNNPP